MIFQYGSKLFLIHWMLIGFEAILENKTHNISVEVIDVNNNTFKCKKKH